MNIFNLLIAVAIVIAILWLGPYVFALIEIFCKSLFSLVGACFVGGIIGGLSLWIVSAIFLNITHYGEMHAFWVGAIIGAVFSFVIVLWSARCRN